MQVQAFFDPDTFTLTHVVFDAASREAVVIDPVLDYDVLASRTSTSTAMELVKRGFRHVYNLRGGMVAWNEARLPVER